MAVKMMIKRKPVIKKYFRLFDFNVYDEVQESSDSDSGSDNGQKKYQKDNKIFVIQMFGVNEKGETCSIYVKDFQPRDYTYIYYFFGRDICYYTLK